MCVCDMTTANVTPLSQSDVTQQVLELKLKALILDTIHNIDITRLLSGAGPSLRDPTHWLWQKQLRHYLREGQCSLSNHLHVHQLCGNVLLVVQVV